MLLKVAAHDPEVAALVEGRHVENPIEHNYDLSLLLLLQDHLVVTCLGPPQQQLPEQRQHELNE